MTHTVNDYSSLLACRRDHLAARAHTEGIDSSLSPSVGKRIFGSSECTLSGKSTVQSLLNKASLVFYSHSHRYRLRNDVELILNKHAVGITRTVAKRQHYRRRKEFPLARRDLDKTVASLAYARQLTTVYDLSAKTFDMCKDIIHNSSQNVRANVRLCLNGYFLRRTEFHKRFEHVRAFGIVDPCQQLSVRKCARSSRTELNI